MIPLRGKLALITGGSRGIGLAIAQNFARQGASTILVARNPDRLHAAVASVQAQCNDNNTTNNNNNANNANNTSPDTSATAHEVVVPFHTGITGDVSSADMWQDLSAKLDGGLLGRRPHPHPHPRGAGLPPNSNKQHDELLLLPDRVDVLVNCAGITQESFLWRTNADKVADILDTNLRGAVLGCKYISKLMAKKYDGLQPVGKGEASIINVSSVMASMGGAGASVYAASKAGLLGLTSALSLELVSRHIRVNALVPGYIETDMTERLSHDQLCGRIPMGRLGKVEEVADAAAFLAQNSYANNCVLTIDGGLSAGFFASP